MNPYVTRLWLVLVLAALPRGESSSLLEKLFGNAKQQNEFYYTTASRDDDIGVENPYSCAGNPLKGLIGNTRFSNYDPWATSIDSSMNFYYVGVDSVMIADPDEVGLEAAFDWTSLEERLEESAAQNRHAVLSFSLHYPGRPLMVPQYLLDYLTLYYYAEFLGGGWSPDYGDPILLRAIELFIAAFGEKYDGDLRIGFINAGLLGMWGEWHVSPLSWLVPEESKLKVTEWYAASFSQTHVLTRYPYEPAYQAGFGYTDGSFAYHTLDFDANGGYNRSDYYFWPLVRDAGHSDFWRRAPMAGETRPELQPIIFEPDYPAGTYERQDFIRCVYETHASYMFHQEAFINGGYQGEEWQRANHAHTRLGYNFLVEQVALAESSSTTPGLVDIEVTVKQVGVAPFYYPLFLVLSCEGLDSSRVLDGVETIIDAGDTKKFSFEGIPATFECFDRLSLTLQSPYSYEGRPIKFAQGFDGLVSLSLPPPPSGWADNLNVTDSSVVNETDSSVVDVGVLYGFSLVTEYEDDHWAIVQSLHNGDRVDISKVGHSLSVRAHVSGTIDQMVFHYNGTLFVENFPPFALGGNIGDVFNPVPYLSQAGNKTIAAIAYDAAGTVIGNRTVSFSLIETTDAPRYETTDAPQYPTLPLNSSQIPAPPSSDGFDNNTHGFNTPATPPLLDLVDEVAGKKNQHEKNPSSLMIAAFVVATVSTLVALGLKSCRCRTTPRESGGPPSATDSEKGNTTSVSAPTDSRDEREVNTLVVEDTDSEASPSIVAPDAKQLQASRVAGKLDPARR